ncbi:MAG: sodium-dependent transporter [Rikenellaceae bacterium]|nr:sodium-dependent transporter [Rikenellaceae bacterium]
MGAETRASFGGRLVAILAAAGSAIGLGSIWRFPYVAGENGGAAFLLVYLLAIFVVGIPVMVAEFAVGRATKKNAVGGYRQLAKGWRWLGYSGIIAALFISGYYYIIAGWSLEYFVNSFGSLYNEGVDFRTQFGIFQTSWRPLLYMVIFVVLTHIIIVRGVQDGIEKASKVMMPMLFVILIFMAIWVAFMPGAGAGYEFFLKPDFAKAFSADTIFSAVGQAFFSLSVGMGCMVTYASYFDKKTNLVGTSFSVSLLTLVVAILAGLVIFPAVFSAGIAPSEGTSLVFVSLPEVFKGMPLPSLFSAIFFLLLALASLTSTISFHEVLTAYISEEFGMSRKWATTITSTLSVVLCVVAMYTAFDVSIPGYNGTMLSDLFDFITASVILPLGGLFTCLFVGWRMKPDFLRGELTNQGTIKSRLYHVLLFLMRYVSPLLIGYIFVSNFV